MTGCRISKIKVTYVQAIKWASQFDMKDSQIILGAIYDGAYGVNGFEIGNPDIDYIPVELVKE